MMQMALSEIQMVLNGDRVDALVESSCVAEVDPFESEKRTLLSVYHSSGKQVPNLLHYQSQLSHCLGSKCTDLLRHSRPILLQRYPRHARALLLAVRLLDVSLE